MRQLLCAVLELDIHLAFSVGALSLVMRQARCVHIA